MMNVKLNNKQNILGKGFIGPYCPCHIGIKVTDLQWTKS